MTIINSSYEHFFKPLKDKESFLLKDSFESTKKLLYPALKNNNISLEYQVDGDIKIYGFKNEFEQVLINIINNSKDAFIHKNIQNKQIHIKAFKQDDKIVIGIRDNAGGIKEDIINKIFEPYFTTKFKSQGTGLGLYMSKMIIENNMQGELTCANTKDGAIFVIKLKIYKPQKQ